LSETRLQGSKSGEDSGEGQNDSQDGGKGRMGLAGRGRGLLLICRHILSNGDEINTEENESNTSASQRVRGSRPGELASSSAL